MKRPLGCLANIFSKVGEHDVVKGEWTQRRLMSMYCFAKCELWSSSKASNSSEADDSGTHETMQVDEDAETEEGIWGAAFVNVTALNDELQTPLFCGSNLSKLDTILMFMNVCRTHKVSNACISELLYLMSKVILPTPNLLPSSERIATSTLSRLGLRYNTIDACKNGCILFRHEYVEMEACPMCHVCRFKRVGSSRVLQKVLRHFPLVPCLRRMFSTP